MIRNALLLALPLAIALSGCKASESTADAEYQAPFAMIGEGETVKFTGTEPFWGGQVVGTALTYSTPENSEGTDIPVTRFAGRGGVSWTGVYDGARFVLAATPGQCSDGMSDRTYPYVVTLEVKGEQRSGCAWTDKQPFTMPSGMAPAS